ncbi:glycoside hydrolase family 3 N-terminal domain-containing protein [Nocardia goodfellowii]
MAWTEDSVRQLVSRLTLEQKVAQLSGLGITDLVDRAAQPADGKSPVIDPGRVPMLAPHGVGHFSLSWFLGHDAESLRRDLAAAQEAARDASPFGIGALVHNEAINGFLHISGSQFPTAWAQAATWSPDLVRRAAEVSSAHFRHSGMHLAFAPVMDINRDPRWGRVHETYGEDPELVAQLSVAFVRGIQGPDSDSGVLATGKHFLGYGASEGGLNKAVTQLGRRALTDEYAEPFRRAVAEAGLVSIMNSYNEIDGVPAVANRWMLTDLLRAQIGFDGLVVSDYDAIPMLLKIYHTASEPGTAAVQALRAGLDVDLPGGTVYRHLVDEVKAGRLEENVVDEAVFRVLRTKARVGLIPEFGPASAAAVLPDPVAATAVRQEIADRASVLLDNDGTLPLSAGGRRVVVLGPASNELRIHFGAYTSVSQSEMPIGMRAIHMGQVPGIDPRTFIFTDIFQPRMPGMDPVFEQTARGIHPDTDTVFEALRRHDDQVSFAELGGFDADPAALTAEAVDAAVGSAEVVVAVVGERTGWVGNNTAGEGQSTAEPVLPGDQERLLELLAATGRKVVTVVVSGRPLLLAAAVRHSHAVLLVPLLGEEGPRVIADTLYGRINPSGKLPSTFPRTVGQLPIYHGHHYGSGYDHPTGTQFGYNDLADNSPLYAFGHGGSYTRFEMRFEESPAPAVADDMITARVRVTNTGDRAGETVVQLYVRDEEATIVRPVRQLLDFERVTLRPDESATVVFSVPLARLAYTQLNGQRGVEAGEITVQGGFAADDIRCVATIAAPELVIGS